MHGLNNNNGKRNKWAWTKDLIKSNSNLIVIVVAALLIELTTGVIYYNSQDIIERTTIQVMERENNALYLSIRNKLAEVEVVLNNMSWIVTDDLLQPSHVLFVTLCPAIQMLITRRRIAGHRNNRGFSIDLSLTPK